MWNVSIGIKRLFSCTPGYSPIRKVSGQYEDKHWRESARSVNQWSVQQSSDVIKETWSHQVSF